MTERAERNTAACRPERCGRRGSPFPVSTVVAASLLAVAATFATVGWPAAARASAERTGPSFDCAKARSPIEQYICADDELSALDREQAHLYFEIRKGLDKPAADRLRADQLQWVKDRRDRCGLGRIGKVRIEPGKLACLKDEFSRRIAIFSNHLGKPAPAAAPSPASPPSPAPAPAPDKCSAVAKKARYRVDQLDSGTDAACLRGDLLIDGVVVSVGDDVALAPTEADAAARPLDLGESGFSRPTFVELFEGRPVTVRGHVEARSGGLTIRLLGVQGAGARTVEAPEQAAEPVAEQTAAARHEDRPTEPQPPAPEPQAPAPPEPGRTAREIVVGVFGPIGELSRSVEGQAYRNSAIGMAMTLFYMRYGAACDYPALAEKHKNLMGLMTVDLAARYELPSERIAEFGSVGMSAASRLAEEGKCADEIAEVLVRQFPSALDTSDFARGGAANPPAGATARQTVSIWCEAGGQVLPALYCVKPGGLKVWRGNDLEIYDERRVPDLSAAPLRLRFEGPFRIEAYNSEESLTMRVKVTDDAGNTVFEDAQSQYGRIRYAR